ncbi:MULTISPECIES: CbiX/SirB N-terminal domain-containing protein [Nitrosopumilus]|uniref:Cobalamin (Vitamin B12) biosynthesis CbiX protein n=1 Tax=Nitrosopumilus piranensis TaxID=1582439 RepID=A0A0C5BST8_9ARCH|nr:MULTISPECIES: CbiX/SirB N-terminal domain-containing protein [Nitrosopumilus]AJM91361.1 Cobalamin (Vitamin B12) biosynthesis CbiX protein [Nitrosopumilus piranensis]KAF6245847.1 sirohydrochlorin cobaltochelatase [Nitrosopumilus sp. b2]
MKRGLLIIDRGSREREASEELETICAGIKAKGNYVFTDYCFLEVEPPFIEDGISKCLNEDIDSLTIVPYFLYPGKKVKLAVTDTMKLQKDTQVKFLITKPMSMHKTLVDIVENRIETTLKENNVTLSNKDVDVMIIGHGSKDPNAQMSLNYIVDELKGSYRNVSRCWLEIEQPDIFEGVKKCEKDQPKILVIVFYFLHEGAHVKTDINNDLIPALKDSNLENTFITKHIGTDEKIIDLIIERAKEVEDAN